MTTWSVSQVVDWLMHRGRHLPTREAVVGELCKDTGEDVVLSSAVAAQLGARCRSLGKFALRGVAGAEEIFALP